MWCTVARHLKGDSQTARPIRITGLRRIAVAVAAVLLAGTASAQAAEPQPTNPDTGRSLAAAATAGPESLAVAGSRPVSGGSPSAGPPFVRQVHSSWWSANSYRPVLRNTVHDADGGTAALIFEVWTFESVNTPGRKIDLDGAGTTGRLVSPFVPVGSNAEVTVDYGILGKADNHYLMRTQAYDGTLYEDGWSPWIAFYVQPYLWTAKGAVANAPAVDCTKLQDIQQFTRSNPGAALPLMAKSGVEKPAEKEQTCGTADAKGRKLCIELKPPTKESEERAKERRAAVREQLIAEERKKGKSAEAATAAVAAAPAVDLVDWCSTQAVGHDYMTRDSACLKSRVRETDLHRYRPRPARSGIGGLRHRAAPEDLPQQGRLRLRLRRVRPAALPGAAADRSGTQRCHHPLERAAHVQLMRDVQRPLGRRRGQHPHRYVRVLERRRHRPAVRRPVGHLPDQMDRHGQGDHQPAGR